MRFRTGRSTRGMMLLGLFAGALLVALPIGSSADAAETCKAGTTEGRTGVAASGERASEVAGIDPQGTGAGAAEIPADTVEPETTSPTAPVESTQPAESAELSIEAATAPHVVEQAEVLTVTITIYNAGPGDEPSVTVSQAIPEGAVLAAPVAGLDSSSGLLDLGGLAAGGSITIAIPLLLPGLTGTVQTTPMVHGETSDAYPINDQTCTLVSVVPVEGQLPPTAGVAEVPEGKRPRGEGVGTSPTSPEPSRGSQAGGSGAPDPGSPEPTRGVEEPDVTPGQRGSSTGSGRPGLAGLGYSHDPVARPPSGGTPPSGDPDARSGGADPSSADPAGGALAVLNTAGWLFLIAGATFLVVGGGGHSRRWR